MDLIEAPFRGKTMHRPAPNNPAFSRWIPKPSPKAAAFLLLIPALLFLLIFIVQWAESYISSVLRDSLASHSIDLDAGGKFNLGLTPWTVDIVGKLSYLTESAVVQVESEIKLPVGISWLWGEGPQYESIELKDAQIDVRPRSSKLSHSMHTARVAGGFRSLEIESSDIVIYSYGDAVSKTRLLDVDISANLNADEEVAGALQGSGRAAIGRITTVPLTFLASGLEGDFQWLDKKLDFRADIHEEQLDTRWEVDFSLDLASLNYICTISNDKINAGYIMAGKEYEDFGSAKIEMEISGELARANSARGKGSIEVSKGVISELPIIKALYDATGVDSLDGSEYQDFTVFFSYRDESFELEPAAIEIGPVSLIVSGEVEGTPEGEIDLEIVVRARRDRLSTLHLPRVLIEALPQDQHEVVLPLRVSGTRRLPLIDW